MAAATIEETVTPKPSKEEKEAAALEEFAQDDKFAETLKALRKAESKAKGGETSVENAMVTIVGLLLDWAEDETSAQFHALAKALHAAPAYASDTTGKGRQYRLLKHWVNSNPDGAKQYKEGTKMVLGAIHRAITPRATVVNASEDTVVEILQRGETAVDTVALIKAAAPDADYTLERHCKTVVKGDEKLVAVSGYVLPAEAEPDEIRALIEAREAARRLLDTLESVDLDAWLQAAQT